MGKSSKRSQASTERVDDDNKRGDDDEEEDDEEELPIAIYDQLAVKKLLDEAICDYVKDAGIDEDYWWDNLKLSIMFVACVVAGIAQLHPSPLEEARTFLMFACGFYFAASGLLQLIYLFVDKDYILVSKPTSQLKTSFPASENEQPKTLPVIKIKTTFPRYQDIYTMVFEFKDTPNITAQKVHSVGRWITDEGFLCSNILKMDVFELLNELSESVNKKEQ